MNKVYLPLKNGQKKRGIIFSSTLSTKRNEQPEDTIHEVHMDDPEKHIKIERLKDDKFFNNSPWQYNIIRS